MDNNQSVNIFRNESKLTDDILTIDSPRRMTSRISRMYNTMQFQNKSDSKVMTGSIYSKFLNTNILNSQEKIWRQSATSIRREKSPSFKFPQTERFSSIEKDEMKNKLILKLDIGKELGGDKGIKFSKAVRKDHFKPREQDFPSPTSYCSQLISGIQSPNIRGSMSRKSLILNGGMKSSKSIIKISSPVSPSINLKGITFPKSQNYSKLFLSHGKNLPYQPELTLNNPGVGKYTINYGQDLYLNKKAYTIGQTLKKFNQYTNPSPGPGAYGTQRQIYLSTRSHSANYKGTIPLSKRTFLVQKNPQEYSPGPNYYKLKRFLQKQ